MDAETLKTVMETFIPFNKVLGLKLVEIGEGFVRCEVPFRDELVGDASRPALHGGVISALADAAGGAAAWSNVDNPRGRVSTIDLRIDYLRPGKLETVVAEARVARSGNRIAVVDVRLFHPANADVTIATAKGVYHISIPKS